MPSFVTYKDSFVEYQYWQGGPMPLVCFHGYGEEATAFYPFSALLPEYSIIAINLPWHGDTVWNEGMDFNADDLVTIVTLIPEIQGHFSVLGYSMGGRVALQLYQAIPDRINQMILIAPDGLNQNFWYWLATQSHLGNRIFRYLMKEPGFFFLMIKSLKKLNLINKGIYNFVLQFLQQEKARTDLYIRWTTFRKIKPSIHAIAALTAKQKTPVLLIYGIHDRVITPKVGYRFAEAAGTTCKVYILNTGHRLLQPKIAEQIAHLLQQ